MRTTASIQLLLGIAIALSACGKKKQYTNYVPPENPDRFESTLVTKPIRGPANSGPVNGADGTGIVDSNTSLTQKDVIDMISAWQAVPVVWNESAGNIVIGETSYNQWYQDLQRYRLVTRFQINFFPTEFNVTRQEGELVASSINQVVLQNGYEGAISFPRDGQLVPAKLGESLSARRIFASSPEGNDLNQENRNLSTRGRAFFREFYNHYIKQDEGDDTFDCFAAGICRYMVERDYWGLIYDSPRGEFGYLYMSRSNNVLIEALFGRPEFVPAGRLAGENVLVNLADGSFWDENGPLLSFGDTFAEAEARLELPEANWYDSPMQFVGDFRGLNLSFRKTQTDRLADSTYNVPHAEDYFSALSIDFTSGNRLFLSLGEEALVLELSDPAREQWERGNFDSEGNAPENTHLSYLNTIKQTMESLLAEQGALIFESQLLNLNSVSATQRYTFRIAFRLPGEERGTILALSTGRRSPYLSAEIVRSEPYELDLLRISRSEEGFWSAGPLVIGNVLRLENVDSFFRSRASIDLNGQTVRVPFTRDTTLKTKSIDSDGNIVTRELNVSAIDIGSFNVFLKSVPCPETSCFQIVGFRSARFYNEDAVDIGEGPQSIPACTENNTIELGMAKTSFERKYRGLLSCPVATLESEAASANKSTYYLPSEGLGLFFLTDSRTSLSSILFYGGGIN